MVTTQEQEYCVQVRVVASAYKTIKATSLAQAKRIVAKQQREGNLTTDLGMDIWEERKEINIAEDFVNGEPQGDWESVEVES